MTIMMKRGRKGESLYDSTEQMYYVSNIFFSFTLRDGLTASCDELPSMMCGGTGI